MANVKLKSSSKLVLPASRGAKQSAAQQETGRPSRSRAAARAAGHPPTTKNAKMLAMLRSPSGATIVAMMKETGWQQHSVRGFLAGVVRKRLKLNLVSEEAKRGRVYRVSDKRSTTRKAAKRSS
jgi:hypothetical protein